MIITFYNYSSGKWEICALPPWISSKSWCGRLDLFRDMGYAIDKTFVFNVDGYIAPCITQLIQGYIVFSEDLKQM